MNQTKKDSIVADLQSVALHAQCHVIWLSCNGRPHDFIACPPRLGAVINGPAARMSALPVLTLRYCKHRV